MGRKKKEASEQVNPPSRFKCLCMKLRIDNNLSIKELAEKLGDYYQSRLSQFETRPEGPPLEIVEKYANYFELKNKERFDFYLAALESSEEINDLNLRKIVPSFLDVFRKFLAFILSDQEVDLILNAKQKDPDFFLDSRNPYNELVNTWTSLEYGFTKFIEEGSKEHSPLPRSLLDLS